MFEIMLALCVLLAAHRRKRRRYNLRKVRIAASSDVGALAALDVASNVIINAASDTYRLISIIASYAWSGKALVDDACSFGLAHSDYTAAEIEECLEAVTAIDLGDKVAQERANRLVREIGTFGSGPAVAGDGGMMFNDGRRVKTRLNWLMSIGDQIQLWMRNGSGVIYTTGSSITIDGEFYLKDGG